MENNRKTISQSPIAIILLVYSIVQFIDILIHGTSLLSIAGVMAATIFYARRYLTAYSVLSIQKGFRLFALISAVVTFAVAMFNGELGVIKIGDIVCSCIVMLGTISTCGRCFKSIENCGIAKLIIIELICVLFVPAIVKTISAMMGFAMLILLIPTVIVVTIWAIVSAIQNK